MWTEGTARTEGGGAGRGFLERTNRMGQPRKARRARTRVQVHELAGIWRRALLTCRHSRVSGARARQVAAEPVGDSPRSAEDNGPQGSTPDAGSGGDGGGDGGGGMRTGPSRAGDVIGDELRFVGMNKAIENRVCINLRRMSWAEPPRTMFIVEKSEGWRTSLGEGGDSRRLEHGCVMVLERICRYCKEHLVCARASTRIHAHPRASTRMHAHARAPTRTHARTHAPPPCAHARACTNTLARAGPDCDSGVAHQT